MQSADVNKAIDSYYKIKGRYDSKFNASKLRIIRSKIPLAEKKQRIERIKVKCINCKRDVGTRFSTADRHLKAVCGDDSAPCPLNIDIKLGIAESLDSLEETLTHDLNLVKRKIIETKLMLLFGLLTEEQMEKAFADLKETYKSLVQAQNMISEKIKDQYMITIKDIGGDRDIERKTLAAANEVKVGNLISDFKRLIREYELDTSPDTKMSKMEDAIDMYLNQIVPTLDTIRTTLFRINTVIKEKKQYKLIQIQVPIDLRVIDLEEPEIVTNKK